MKLAKFLRIYMYADIEALYDFRRSSYESCLQLSKQNVNSLWFQTDYLDVILSHSTTVLLGDVLASLSGLWIVTSELRSEGNSNKFHYFHIAQITLSVYLLVCSRLKLNQATRYLIDELRVVMSLNDRHPVDNVRERLLLSFVYRYTLTKIKKQLTPHTLTTIYPI